MGLPQQKWVFTNCSEKHAWHALQLLGLQVCSFTSPSWHALWRGDLSAAGMRMACSQDCFKGVVGADLMGDACKPEAAAFATALRRTGAEPARTAMFEDSVKNLRAAKALGLTTLLVTGATAAEEGADAAALAFCDATVPALHEPDVRIALPSLWP